jgi:hypothetical protein
MANTFAADLAAVQSDTLTSLLFQGLNKRTILSQLATYHDLRGANGPTVKFPVVAEMTAVKVIDSQPTPYQTIAPDATEAVIEELVAAASISRFAQDTSPIKSPMDIAESLMSAIADGVEQLLVDEAVDGPVDETGADGNAFDLADMRAAMALAGVDRDDFSWLLNRDVEGGLLGDSALSNAAAYGSAMVIQDGRPARLYGGDVFFSRWLPDNRSALVAPSTLHYGIASENPELEIVYDPDIRSDKIVARVSVAVKYVPQPEVKGVRIRHT